jgi:hypothetical protein
MSKMSDVSIDIQNMLEDGEYPVVIARQLSIPVAWVYTVLEQTDSDCIEDDRCRLATGYN